MMVDVPAAATRLATKAGEHGWTVQTETHAGEHRGRPMESVALFLRRRDERLVARWDNGKFAGAWQKWRPEPPEGGVSPRKISSRELQALVTA